MQLNPAKGFRKPHTNFLVLLSIHALVVELCTSIFCVTVMMVHFNVSFENTQNMQQYIIKITSTKVNDNLW